MKQLPQNISKLQKRILELEKAIKVNCRSCNPDFYKNCEMTDCALHKINQQLFL